MLIQTLYLKIKKKSQDNDQSQNNDQDLQQEPLTEEQKQALRLKIYHLGFWQGVLQEKKDRLFRRSKKRWYFRGR